MGTFLDTVRNGNSEFVIMELGIDKKTHCLDLIAKKLGDFDKFKLIRVPYYNPRSFKPDDKYEPDVRELNETDPIFKLHKDNIVRIREGAPIVLQSIVDALDTNALEEKAKKISQPIWWQRPDTG